jgi:curved DNA-binding protein CbpA
MFKDYYAILEIEVDATLLEIKSAFKKQAIRWHPDKNNGVDTTRQMQEINEAYIILRETESRERYDIEYRRFKRYYQNQDKQNSKNIYENNDYVINDETLKKWMENAKQQAVSLAKKTIEDFRGMVSIGIKEAAREASIYVIFYIVLSIILIILFLFFKFLRN